MIASTPVTHSSGFGSQSVESRIVIASFSKRNDNVLVSLSKRFHP